MEPPLDERRAVTLDEAIAMAVLFQKSGHLTDAADLYSQIIAVAPDHVDVLHYAGILAHQQGRHDEAVRLIERSLALAPDRADCYNNLGIIYKAQGQIDEAVVAYRRALDLDPQHANAWSNLGVLHRAQGRPVESEEAYRAAIRLDPGHIDAWHNLGVLLGSQRRTKEAVACYCKVTTLSPEHPQARRLLALAYCTLGQVDKAIDIFERWLADEPDNPIPRHLLAACSGTAVPPRAADAFVEATFDQFATSFDAKLKQLSYRAPALVHATIVDAGLPADGRLDVLDVGCGTGLCGTLVASYARRLIGVDLSARMLDEARAKNVYDDLVKAELTGYLQQHEGAFDLVISADTLVYFGRLDDVVAAVARALRPGGAFIFTLEEASDDRAPEGYVLETHGRYSHSRRHVDQLIRHAQLSPAIVQAELRMESGVPVAGMVVHAVKAPMTSLHSADTAPAQEASGRTGDRSM